MIENILVALSFIIGLIVSRIIFLLLRINTNTANKYSTTKRLSPIKTIICVGSGGHTTEMIKLIENINPINYTPRYYIMANTDIVSEEKIVTLEQKFTSSKHSSHYEIVKIPRSRIVNQSYFTSIFTTINSILYCIPIVFDIKPNLILCNGPGTCIPICLIAFILKLFFICDTRIVFVESICRVESLSLTGKILNYFADNIIIQWEELKGVCKRADYIGQLF